MCARLHVGGDVKSDVGGKLRTGSVLTGWKVNGFNIIIKTKFLITETVNTNAFARKM